MRRRSLHLPTFALAAALACTTVGLAQPAAQPAASPPDRLDPALVRHTGETSTVVFGSGRYLTGPSAKPAGRIVLDYLAKHRETFGLSQPALAALTVSKDIRTAHDGAHHLVLEQRFRGLRVDGATITALVDREGRLVLVGGPSAGGAATGGAAALTAGDAIRVTAQRSGVANAKAPASSTTRAAGIHEFRNTYARGVHNPSPVSAELVWALRPDRSLTLAWRTDVESGPTSWFTGLVDARTGAVLEHATRYAHSGAEGNVITGQHPDADPTQEIVPFTGIDGSWVNGSVTSGNNVDAYLDRDNQSVNNEYQPSNADQHFNYTFTDAWRTTADQTSLAALDADRDAIITQLFYYTNDLHDWLYNHGFDEVSGNFQVDNFGRGGVGGDPVQAEAQDGYMFGCDDGDGTPNEDPGDRCRNNAFFGTGNDGTTPRMQMYMWIPTRPFRDGSMDGDVIAHEYGHGVERRLVPGGIALGATNQGGSLAEGWSDTISFLRWGDATVGEYVTGNADGGIRSEDYDEHTATYGDYSTAVGSPHPNGEIWAATMYDVRVALGLNAGTIRLILDGMRNTVNGPTPSFLDARDGVLAADMASNAGANQCELWSVFAGRGMGVDAVSNGVHAVPTEDFDVPAACLPTADAGGPYATVEGTDVALSGSGTPGSDPSAGAVTAYAWDLDNDGQYDDSNLQNPVFTDVGQDGSFTVGLQVTDQFGNTATDTASVTVSNVAPTVSIDPITPIDEHGTATVSGTITDPGWEETLTATIDFGDGTATVPLSPTATDNVRPDATFDFSVNRQYGDNGTFTVTVTGFDDDTSSNDTGGVVVGNIDPTATIDGSGEQVYDGVSAFVVEAGEDLTVPVNSTDPGSDDLTFMWNWDDGSTSSETSLVNPPLVDPASSPSIQPRDVTLDATHAFGDACLYDLGVDVDDDDGGTASDSAVVLVTGNADISRGHGWWLNQYRPKAPNDFTDAEFQCFLDIVNFLSLVFSEETTANTRASATEVLNAPAKAPAVVIFDQHVLGAWLNFANGSVKLDTPVDTDGNGIDDSTFGAVMFAAESVRIDPASTTAQIKAQKDIIARIITQSA